METVKEKKERQAAALAAQQAERDALLQQEQEEREAAEAEEAGTEKPKTPETPAPKLDALKWERQTIYTREDGRMQIDKFPQLKKAGDSFTGHFLTELKDDEENPTNFEGLVFQEYESDNVCLLPANFQLQKYFAEVAEGDFSTVYKIELLEVRELKNGRTFKNFKIYKAKV